MKRLLIITLCIFPLLVGCSKDVDNEMDLLKEKYPNNITYYELFVRSSFDSNNDGIGDFKGIENNVQYFTNLGIEGIWLMPINKSNSYHGYDIINYLDTKEEYGTLEEFKSMVDTLNDNNIRVMMDLVVNHTSDQHEWFISSKEESSKYRDYYIYQNNKPYSSFVGGMYDLNLDNEEVVNEIINIGKYYIEMGVSGFRLDAAKHFFQADENNINPSYAITKSNDFIRTISNEFKKFNEDIFVTAEVLDSNLLSSQFFKGADSAFNFDVRDKMLQVASGLSATSYANVLYNNYSLISKYNNDFIDSVFATNHDLNRISYELNKDSIYYERQLKLVADMLLSLPGSPFIYYGDELGQCGYRQEGAVVEGYDNLVYDELRRLPLKLGNEYETSWIKTNIDNDVDSYLVQKEDSDSLYNHYKNMINIRNDNKALKYGNDFQKTNLDLKFATSFIRRFEGQNLLIIHNPYQENLDISYLNLDNIIYKTFNSDKDNVDCYSTVIFEISDDKVKGLM